MCAKDAKPASELVALVVNLLQELTRAGNSIHDFLEEFFGSLPSNLHKLIISESKRGKT
jgi:hypothetical protein